MSIFFSEFFTFILIHFIFYIYIYLYRSDDFSSEYNLTLERYHEYVNEYIVIKLRDKLMNIFKMLQHEKIEQKIIMINFILFTHHHLHIYTLFSSSCSSFSSSSSSQVSYLSFLLNLSQSLFLPAPLNFKDSVQFSKVNDNFLLFFQY